MNTLHLFLFCCVGLSCVVILESVKCYVCTHCEKAKPSEFDCGGLIEGCVKTSVKVEDTTFVTKGCGTSCGLLSKDNCWTCKGDLCNSSIIYTGSILAITVMNLVVILGI